MGGAVAVTRRKQEVDRKWKAQKGGRGLNEAASRRQRTGYFRLKQDVMRLEWI